MHPVPKEMEHQFGEDELLVSKTDTAGKITYVNKRFMEIVGYSEQELLGKPHNLVRHPDMPKIIFKLLWETLKAKREIHAYVKNLCKDGGYYWVMANVTPSFDVNEKVVGYHSARRKPTTRAMAVIKPLYAQLLDAERSGGLQASEKIVNALLKEKGMDYDEFILSL